MDLAKRLSEELAAQQAKQSGSLGTNRALSPDAEPRSRSYEQQHPKTKGNYYIVPVFKIKKQLLFLTIALTQNLSFLFFENNNVNTLKTLSRVAYIYIL